MEQVLYRTTLLICGLLSVGVLANLFAMQRPEPRLAVASGPVEKHRKSPASRLAAGPQSDLVRAVQRELQAKGYIRRAPDGALDMSTRAAIWAWEVDNGLPPTAAPSGDLLKALLLGAAVDRRPAPTTQPDGVGRLMQHVQMLLKSRTEIDLALTGRFDEATRRAISAFEQRLGLPATGRINAALVLRLENAGLHGR